MATKMSVKRNSNKAMHMRKLWSSCLTTHRSFTVHLCWMTLKRKFSATFFGAGHCRTRSAHGLTDSWECHNNGSWYKQPKQIRNWEKKEIKKLHHDFFSHTKQTCLGLVICTAYSMLQNHAWVWGRGKRDIISCLSDTASVLESWWYFNR